MNLSDQRHVWEICVKFTRIGRMTDGTEEIHGSYYPLENTPPDPMDRRIISEVLPLGVKAVDGLITVGKGQRIGVFAGSGVGKSTLLGMFARNTNREFLPFHPSCVRFHPAYAQAVLLQPELTGDVRYFPQCIRFQPLPRCQPASGSVWNPENQPLPR